MAKTANELLQGILTTVASIDRKSTEEQKQQKGGGTSGVKDVLNIASALNKFGRTKPETRTNFITFMNDVVKIVKESNKGKDFQTFSNGIVSISTALPELVRGLNDLSSMKTRRVDKALNTLRKLYDFMYELGDSRSARKIERSIKLFDSIGKSLNRIARPLRRISSFLSYLGLSFVVFAAGIVASSKLLKLASPLGIIGVTLGVVGVLVGIIALLSLSNRFLRPGLKTIRGVGMGFMMLSAGIIGFTLSLLLLSSYLKTGNDAKGIGKGMLVLGGVILLVVGMFALLGLANKTGVISRGTRAVRGIGVGLLLLTVGVLGFTLGLLGVAALMGASEDGNGIFKAMGIMGLVIVGVVGLFWLLGKAAKTVALGSLTALLVAVGIGAMAYSITYLANAAAQIGSLLKGGDKSGKPVSFLGYEVPPAVAGLGMIGMVFVGAAALFALMGIPVVAGLILLGAVTAAAVAGTLILLAIAVKKLVDVSANIPKDFDKNLEHMISGVLAGTIGGLTKGLLGKRGEGGNKLKVALKNTAILIGGIGILFTVSLTLSMFAKALTAFAELDNMREITGYEENGKPIFGDKINISKVSENISSSISTFLSAVIQSTIGLSRDQAKAIRKMGRALTGRRGILSAVIQFTEVLKVYGQYGPDGMIGYSYTEQSGVDEDGNPIYVQKKGRVQINTVAKNMVNAFTTFVNELTSRTEGEFGPDRKGRRKIRQMSRLLTGKRGILSAVIDFAETLEFYAKYGKEGKVPVIDAEGNPTGKFLTMSEVAKNIVNSVTTFSETLGNAIDADDKKNAKRAKKTLGKFDGLIKQMNKLTQAQDGMERMAKSMKELGENIGLLAVNLNKLDTGKLGDVANVSAAYLEKTNDFSNSNKRIMDKSTASNTRPTYTSSAPGSNVQYSQTNTNSARGSQQKPTDWDEVAQVIGNEVGAKVTSALKSGMFKFEFDTSKTGGVYYWTPN